MLPSVKPRPPGVIGSSAASWPAAYASSKSPPRQDPSDREECDREAGHVSGPVEQHPAKANAPATRTERQFREYIPADEPLDAATTGHPCGEFAHRPRPPAHSVNRDNGHESSDDHAEDDGCDNPQVGNVLARRRELSAHEADEDERDDVQQADHGEHPQGQHLADPAPGEASKHDHVGNEITDRQHTPHRLTGDRQPSEGANTDRDTTRAQQSALGEGDRSVRAPLGQDRDAEPGPRDPAKVAYGAE